MQAKFDEAKEAQNQANAALQDGVNELRKGGYHKEADALQKKYANCGCTC